MRGSSRLSDSPGDAPHLSPPSSAPPSASKPQVNVRSIIEPNAAPPDLLAKLAAEPGVSVAQAAEPAGAPDVPAVATPDTGRSSIANSIGSFGRDLFQQAAFLCAKSCADVISPGAGLMVTVAHAAIKAVAALRSVNDGDGFFVMIPGHVPNMDLAFSVGVRQASDGFGVRFRVDLMDHVYADGAPGALPAQVQHGKVPGDWIDQYGLVGIRNPSKVLARGPEVVRLPDGPPQFADQRASGNSIDWEWMPRQRLYRITVPGHPPQDFPTGR